MQVANTLNNTIRILFNPRVEPFKLFDFLVVKSDDSRYVAQIIEIYDDKFDGSQNVAKIKLFYRINENDEVTPYDNFTPNKECEIVKIKHEEIENFVNQDNETFVFGTNIKNSSSLNIQYKFFDNNAVVLADKIENAVCMTYNLAKKLSNKKNVIIIDSTGSLELEGAKKIKASKNFKMPLNYATIDHVFNKCLADSSLEFQAIGGEIINEIKRFAKKQEGQFIPFNMLTKVLLEQYNATPYPELKVLLMRIKKFQMDDIFAKNKNDKDNLAKAVEKNPITIIDLSTISPYWQKIYIDYIISEIEQEIYLITRINDEHFDTNLINKIYNKKSNIKFVPTVSYNYKKLPTVMQYCKNYILMPSLQQRNDFLDANFALSNLIPEGCIIFGKNTDNFLYLARDYELEIQESKKNYKKIELSSALTQNPMQHNPDEKTDYYEKKERAEKLKEQEAQTSNEIASFKAQKTEKFSEAVSFSKTPIQEIAPQKSKEDFEIIENPAKDQNGITIEEDYFATIEENVEVKSEAQDDFQELEIEEKEVKLEEESDFFNNDKTEAEEDEFEEIEEETEVELEKEEDEVEEGLTFEDIVGSKEKKTEDILEEETKENTEEPIEETIEELIEEPAEKPAEKSLIDEFMSSDEDIKEAQTEEQQEEQEPLKEETSELTVDEIFQQEAEIVDSETAIEETQEVEVQELEIQDEEIKLETEDEVFKQEIEEPTAQTTQPPVEKAEQYEMGLIEFDVKEETQEAKKAEENIEKEPQEDTFQINSEEISLEEGFVIADTELNIETQELDILSDENSKEINEETQEEIIAQDETDTTIQEDFLASEEASQEQVAISEETTQEEAIQKETNEEEDFNLSDDELDFFEMADGDFEDDDEEAQEENEEGSISFEDDEDVDLSAIADSSIDSNFEEIINTKSKQNSSGVAIDENTKIDIDIVNSQGSENQNLPIFREKRAKSEITFKKGDRVFHPKFGSGVIEAVGESSVGVVVKVRFDDGTVKPLEPVTAKLELEQ